MGIVDINWRKVETEALKVIDQDGDKKFDQKDLSILWNKLKKVLLYQLPSSGESRGTQYSHLKGVHARDYHRHQGKAYIISTANAFCTGGFLAGFSVGFYRG